tara:strand:- start:189 stop:461 length:273 start_codon:yes stop_codon:yes gene_type:complete
VEAINRDAALTHIEALWAVKAVNRKVGLVNSKVGSVNSRVDSVNSRVDSVNSKVGSVNSKEGLVSNQCLEVLMGKTQDFPDNDLILTMAI